MVSLGEIVSQIKKGNFKPENVPSADLFLQEHNELLLIEHLVSQKIVNLMQVRDTLSHYASLISKAPVLRETHLLALAKYIRIMCLHIIQTHTLDNIAAVNDALTEYFPFLSENIENTRWLPKFLEDTNMKEIIYHLLAHVSFRINIGHIVAAKGSCDEITRNINQLTIQLRTMATHRLYTTHRNPAINELNRVTAQAGALLSRIPVVSFFQGGVQSLASAAGYDQRTQTGRTNKILSYITPLRTLTKNNLSEYTPQQKKAHIELLVAIYLEAAETLQITMADLLDDLITHHRNDKDLLVAILKTIAPEPLGEMYYGMQARPSNLLGALTNNSNMILFEACGYLFEGEERIAFNNTLMKLTRPGAKLDALNFDAPLSNATRWLAYLLSMGNLDSVQNVTITYNDLQHRDHLLISYLMGSKKLVLSSTSPIHDAILSPLPVQCVLKNYHALMGYAIITQMATVALQQGVPMLRLEFISTYKHVDELLNNKAMFENAPNDGSVYFRIALQDANNAMIDFTLSRTAVRPGVITLASEEATNLLIHQFMNAFSSDWSQLLEPPKALSNNDALPFLRPIAIPLRIVNNTELFGKIEAHHGRHWLLVYHEIMTPGSKNIQKVFYYDINVCRDASSNDASLEMGYFSRLGHGLPKRLETDFPGIIEPNAPTDLKRLPFSSKERDLNPVKPRHK